MPTKARTVEIRNLAGVLEVCKLAGGVPRSTLKLWRAKHGFPKPIRTIGRRTEIWDAAEVRAWLEQHPRRQRSEDD